TCPCCTAKCCTTCPPPASSANPTQRGEKHRPGSKGGRGRQPIELPLPAGGVDLQKGDELGRFHYGSTVILVLPPGMLALDEGVAPGLELQMGRRLATVTGA
ncbi:MAG: phosphatidylserine decarboxylase, partial [Steroidobacteraceae bacterium]